jgi:RNA recognition motif-containing protein
VSKVFVGNLSFDTTREELEALFAPIGEISDVFVPLDRDSGRPRGFAFVTYASGESATEAIQKLDGVELGGRNLRVNEATAERSGGRPGGGVSEREISPSSHAVRKTAQTHKRPQHRAIRLHTTASFLGGAISASQPVLGALRQSLDAPSVRREPMRAG